MGFSLMGNGKFGSGLLGMGLFGGSDSSAMDGVQVPQWWEDPNYRQTQDFLQPYGENILNGNIPDYYKPIGEVGGSEFEKYLALTNRDLALGASEALAKSGRARGGALPAVTAQQIGDNSIKARYADFNRAMQGRAGLFDVGRGITEGVRSAGIQNQGQRNQFNLGAFDAAFNKAKYMDAYDRQSAQDLGQTLGTLGGGALGFMVGGPAGAMAGAGLGGSLFGGGGGSDISQYMDVFAKKPALSSGVTTESALPGVSKFGSISGALSGFYKANPFLLN